MCNGYFGDNNIPIAKLRKDVEILRIAPTSSKCVNVGSDGETRCELVENQLTLGPIYKVASYMIYSCVKIEPCQNSINKSPVLSFFSNYDF